MNYYEPGINQPDILIVDDDPSVILALRKVLATMGKCRFASNGTEALDMVEEALPDIILLDIQMPGMGGLSVCANLKAKPETVGVPVLFITSHVDMETEERVFEVGGADYIVKPLNLRVVAARTRIHLAYAKALAALSVQAFKDGLTGINNRRKFDEQLEREWKRALRHKMPLSLLMIDIDEFKKYNDHFGHLEGDSALKSVALALANCSKRPGDFLARYGGEEFALILPDSDAEGARAMAEIILNSFEALRLAHAPDARRSYLTVSVGCTTMIPAEHDYSKLTMDSLIASADKALYTSKKAGGNCSNSAQLDLAQQ